MGECLGSTRGRLPAPLDFGRGVTGVFTVWSPDRELNPRYVDVPDIDPFGLILYHPRPDDSRECASSLDVDTPERQQAMAAGRWPPRPVWQVLSLDPLTLSPSTRCRACGLHGFIRDGRWVPA